MFRRKNKQPKEYVHIEFFRLRERRWDNFIRTCEKFDHVQIKGGRAYGYKKEEVTQILIPELCVTPIYS